MVSEMLLNLLRHRLPDSCVAAIDTLLGSMMKNHSNNSKLVELFSALAVRSDVESVEAVRVWIGTLVEVISAGNGNSNHREVVKQLLKQRNEILVRTLPQNFDYFSLVGSAC